MSYAPPISKGVRVFYSYSHKDEKLRRQLDSHISSLQIQRLVETWDDRQIPPGKNWADEISENLRSADIILLLLSSDFISSDYCVREEMTAAMRRHASGDAKVIPVILRACDWWDVPFDGGEGVRRLGALQALPKDGKPVSEWKSRDRAFLDVVEGIKRTIFEAAEAVRPREAARVVVQAAPPLGELTPYLCDRSTQESRLESAVRRWRASGMTKRPFVCLVHGDEDDELDKFLERLQEDALPRILSSGTPPGEEPLHNSPLSKLAAHFLPLPSPVGVTRPFEFLRQAVGLKVADSIEADEKAVAEAVSRRSTTPILFHSNLSSRDWGSDGEAVLRAYVDFWRSFPDVKAGRALAFLFQKYRTGGEADARARFAELNERAATSLGALELKLGPEGDDYGGVHAVVLPRLPRVLFRDAEAWFHNRKHFGNRCREHPLELCRVEQAVSQVERFYDEHELAPSAGVPMKLLAPRLREIAEASHCGVAA